MSKSVFKYVGCFRAKKNDPPFGGGSFAILL